MQRRDESLLGWLFRVLCSCQTIEQYQSLGQWLERLKRQPGANKSVQRLAEIVNARAKEFSYE